jgi:hypothetical protein
MSGLTDATRAADRYLPGFAAAMRELRARDPRAADQIGFYVKALRDEARLRRLKCQTLTQEVDALRLVNAEAPVPESVEGEDQ